MRMPTSLQIVTSFCVLCVAPVSWCSAELIAHFPLDEDAVSAVGDFEGFVPDSVTFDDGGGVFGGAAEFEGFEGIEVPYDEALNPEEAFSVTAWVNPIDTTDWNSVITSRAHFADENGETAISGYIIYNTPNNEWDFWTGFGPSGTWGRNIGPMAELDEWQHLAITYDGDTDTKVLYVNGEEEGVVSGQGYVPNPTFSLWLGAGDDVGNNFFFTGLMDDVSIWDEALDAAAISRIMEVGVANFMAGGEPGDFNGDGDLDAADINLLSLEIRNGGMGEAFDVNMDDAVDLTDRVYWIEELKNTWIGDSNLDGEFNSSDFVLVFTAAEYEDDVALNSVWETGDWNGDGDFDSSDFVSAFISGGYDAGKRPAMVPEPSNLACLSLIGLAVMAQTMRRRRAKLV